MNGIKEIMNEFYSLSGLQVSYSKSEILFGDVLSFYHQHLASILELKVGLLAIRHLGVPLIIGKLKDQIF